MIISYFHRKTLSGCIILPLFHTDTCTLHSSLAGLQSLKKFQYAEHEQPKDFCWIFSENKLAEQFKNTTDKDIGEEVDIAQRGRYRLETVQSILKDIGAIGHDPMQPEVICALLVLSCFFIG